MAKRSLGISREKVRAVLGSAVWKVAFWTRSPTTSGRTPYATSRPRPEYG